MELEEEYKQTVESLFNRRPTSRADHDELLLALEAMEKPHLSYPTVHITGTNGKGQVAVKIARSLEFAGYKVGLFISPHLFQYEERITINQVKIPKEKVVDYDKEILALMQEKNLALNFFECSFLFACHYFAEEKVDVAIFEAGIGGRMDSTNVVTPLVSIITSVSKDHVGVLGDTLEEIAWEKAGIIKRNTPVVIGPRAKFLPILREAEEKKAPLRIVERKACFYDTENLATAREALSVLSEHFTLSKKDLEKGLKETLPCRFEKKGNVIFDVAHNPDGMQRLSDALAHLYPNRKFRFVFGMGNDKDLKGSLKNIEPKASHFHFVQAEQPESASPEELAEALKTCSDCPYSLETSISEGIANAKAATPKGENFIVCGSFYIMKEAYAQA